MKTEAHGGESKGAVKVEWHRVGENLWRLGESGKYYAFLKQGDKQFRRSLKTTDRKLAERRLAELRSQVGTLKTGPETRQTFQEVANRWMAVTAHRLKASSAVRRDLCIRSLVPFFDELPIRNIQPHHCERWLTERGKHLAPMTMNRELELMKSVFGYAVKNGLILHNPAEDLQRRRVVQAQITIPTREQFKQLVTAIRQSDGRTDSKAKAKPGADLVELLAYSGCRLTEGASIRWRDVDFEKNTLRITGGELGTKNHEQRIIPMTEALRTLLLRLRNERHPRPDHFVSQIDSAKKCLENACRRLTFPRFTHHDFRHFFATTCIEAGVDIPTVSRWLGHKDGGALAMRVYGHLRADHSAGMVKRVVF
ncbi:MAG: site-specific integrase [Opitutaceae bacterium]|nr:site-specific integrase [Opitutaceae bacterium]